VLIWRWWAREMIKAGRMDDAERFLAESVQLQSGG
jgi:hypothetical protein